MNSGQMRTVSLASILPQFQRLILRPAARTSPEREQPTEDGLFGSVDQCAVKKMVAVIGKVTTTSRTTRKWVCPLGDVETEPTWSIPMT